MHSNHGGSPHLRGLAHQMSKKEPPKGNSFEKAKETVEHGQPQHDKPMTQAHPQTGVHSVHTFHMGGGKAMTHTHHESGGGNPEIREHGSMQEAHQHAQDMLPDDGHQEPDGDEAPMDSPIPDDGSSIGSMA